MAGLRPISFAVAALALVDPRSGNRWLFDATPDLPRQLQRLDRAAPADSRPEIAGIFLTHAHIGHYLGLAHLGHEVMGAQGVPVWAMPKMREYLSSNGPWDQLVRFGNIALRELADGVRVERDMSGFPHPFISHSMERLSGLPADERGKVRFIHLNHSNPAHWPESPERKRVEEGGFRIAVEGELEEL